MHPKLIDIITADVCRVFYLREEAVFELKVEYGMKFIEDRFEDSPEVAEALKSMPEFWNWWRERWAHRDREMMKRCEPKFFGFNYTFLLNGYIGTQRMQDTRRIFHEDVWEFYEDFHYWRKVDYYPNTELVCTAIKRKTNQNNYEQSNDKTESGKGA